MHLCVMCTHHHNTAKDCWRGASMTANIKVLRMDRVAAGIRLKVWILLAMALHQTMRKDFLANQVHLNINKYTI